MAKTLWAEVRYQHQTQPWFQQRKSSCSQWEFCPAWGSSSGSTSQQSASAVLPMKLRVPRRTVGKVCRAGGHSKTGTARRLRHVELLGKAEGINKGGIQVCPEQSCSCPVEPKCTSENRLSLHCSCHGHGSNGLDGRRYTEQREAWGVNRTRSCSLCEPDATVTRDAESP